MSSKAEKQKSEKSSILGADLYWEWRCTIEELKTAKLDEKRVHLERELLNKEIENKKLKLALFKDVLSSSQSKVQAATKEYEKMKAQIEDKVGFSLNNCVIDDITYEVKKLDNNN